jgi:hypothetical protein
MFHTLHDMDSRKQMPDKAPAMHAYKDVYFYGKGFFPTQVLVQIIAGKISKFSAFQHCPVS